MYVYTQNNRLWESTKGAILKIKCKKQSHLIFVVNMKFS